MGALSALPYGQSPLAFTAIIFGLLYTTLLIKRFLNDRKIARLGGRAPIRRGWTPFGIGFIYSAVKRAMAYEDYNFWVTSIMKDGNPKRPWTVEFKLLEQRTVFTADEENIKAILATQFSDYGKGPRFNRDWYDVLGNSIFTTDGKLWHDSRQLIRPQFIKDRVSDLAMFETHLSIMMPQLRPRPGTPVNATELFYRYTLDSATDFLLGSSVSSLITPQNRFAEAFADVQRIQSFIARSGPANRFVPRKKLWTGLKVMDQFLQPFIEETLRMSSAEIEEKTKADKGYTFLHALAAFTRDRRVLRDQLVSVLLAARDTTAVTLAWLFYTLSLHPEVVSRLRAEILERLGRDRAPTYADLKEMKYLQYTLNEILRIYPPVPFNVRVALKDTTLPHGAGPDGLSPVGIPEGTPVGYSTAVLQRRADIYPPTSEKFPDPKKFAPDRWYGWTPKSWTYIPFNGGPRICIGQPFALTELGYTTVRILQRYAKVQNAMGGEVPKEKSEIVMQPSIGIRVVFHED